MKQFMLGAIALIAILPACNNNSTTGKASEAPGQDSMTKETTASGTPALKERPASAVSALASDYLTMKNAFTADDDKAAAAAGNEMVKALSGLDTTGITPAQSKALADVRDDVQENAEHIGKNAGNIKHQREHFDLLSKDMIRLVKAFGAGQLLYIDHCPMYNNDKGADWLSETKEIKNPYLGKAMPDCGTVQEELK